jgi:hypothetical protein
MGVGEVVGVTVGVGVGVVEGVGMGVLYPYGVGVGDAGSGVGEPAKTTSNPCQ